jgi:saccharopine dehydrogenase-like NADP-dependent oxidoreductase
MHKILVIGAGKIGQAISKLLYNTEGYEVTLSDNNPLLIKKLRSGPKIASGYYDVDLGYSEGRHYDSVLSACPYTANVEIAKYALEHGSSYFDLTEDIYVTKEIIELAERANPGQIFMPQCGLAPGFIGILAYDMWKQFDSACELTMRVGALPLYPSNRLKYNLNWSTEGLINEYSNPCESIVHTKLVNGISLEELEIISLDGTEYEAFNTSGGLGTLCETLEGKVINMNYKTLRYPGHRDLMSFLIRDLNLGTTEDKRTLLKQLLEDNFPTTSQDIVIALCKITGWKDGKFSELTNLFKIKHQEILEDNWTAIQIATASAACVAIDLHAQGKLPTIGFVHQEDISLDMFLNNTFGHFYLKGKN